VSEEPQFTSALEAGVEVEVPVGATGVFVAVPAAGTVVFVGVLVACAVVLVCVGVATDDLPKAMAKMWSAEVDGVPGVAALATGITMLVAVLPGFSETEVK
jgi:hypothetical protein